MKPLVTCAWYPAHLDTESGSHSGIDRLIPWLLRNRQRHRTRGSVARRPHVSALPCPEGPTPAWFTRYPKHPISLVIGEGDPSSRLSELYPINQVTLSVP